MVYSVVIDYDTGTSLWRCLTTAGDWVQVRPDARFQCFPAQHLSSALHQRRMSISTHVSASTSIWPFV